jgi:ribose transport system substrate-binding protein
MAQLTRRLAVAATAVAFAATVVAGCGGGGGGNGGNGSSDGGNGSSSNPTGSGAAAQSGDSRDTYVWVASNIADPFYVPGKNGWTDAGKAYGVKTKLVGPQSADVQQQITDIQNAINDPSTAGILLYPADYTTIGPVLKQAQAKGIPVVIGNGDVAANLQPYRDAFVGTDNEQLGADAADVVAKLLHDHGTVGIVSFFTALNHQQRVAGFKAELKAHHPGIQVLGIASEDGTPQKAASAAGAFLQAHPDVNALWTTDASSGAVAQVIAQQGKKGKVLAVGTDRTPQELKAVQDGTVAATITQDTYAEEYVALTDLFWLHGKILSPPEQSITRTLVVDKSNVGKVTAGN